MYGFIRDVIADKGSHVFTIPASASVAEAVSLMNQEGIGAVLVLQRESVAGIFTERDVLRRVVDPGIDPATIRVRDVMSSDLITVTPDTRTDQAMEMMTRMRCRHFPVLDAGELVGFVSIGDLMRWVLISQEAELEHMTDYITGRQPA